MDNLKIATLNVRGLNDNLKRRRVFRYMKLHKVDVCMLQETHCTNKSETIFSNMWGNKCVFAHGASNCRGVALLFSKKCAKNVSDIRRDIDGRFVLCKLQVGEYTYCIANIYAPNDDSPNFFGEIFNHVRELDCVFQVMGGDFNVALNPEIDRSVNRIYNGNSRELITKELDSNNWVDPWRNKHPDKKAFTWMRGMNKSEWSCIDYFLVSGNVYNNCIKADILPSLISDHCMVEMTIEVCNVKRGPWILENLIMNFYGTTSSVPKWRR